MFHVKPRRDEKAVQKGAAMLAPAITSRIDAVGQTPSTNLVPGCFVVVPGPSTPWRQRLT